MPLFTSIIVGAWLLVNAMYHFDVTPEKYKTFHFKHKVEVSKEIKAPDDKK
jgi:hypothetical protein